MTEKPEKPEKQYCGSIDIYVGNGGKPPISVPMYEQDTLEEIQARMDAAIEEAQRDVFNLSGGNQNFTLTVKHDGEN
jgi:phage tail sheath gpL-like